ncbi:MAG: pucA [Cyanobacteria bacterium RYN_339]|nr:pucA [Cyanobacteria bacterium RYN_339]
MHEARTLLDAARLLSPAAGALATVVGLCGSGYRRPGARLLAAQDGRLVGGISGGCLEADALEHAREVMAEGRARLVTYDTTDPLDVLLGVGLGCEGVLEVVIEPLASPSCQAFLAAWEETLAGAGPLAHQLDPRGRRRLARGGRELWCDAGFAPADAFEEILLPPPALWICGAGLDAPPMAALALAQGYAVTVLDHRPAYARPERFPGCRVRGAVPGEERAAAVLLMTHHFEADRGWLARFLPEAPAYLGLLGPRRRARRLLDELGIAGWPRELHAPMGLDLGAETPAEIALATLAEVRQVLAGRSGASLRARDGGIHAAAHPDRIPTP